MRVTTRRAGEIIWTLASPDVARMLCDQLGWTQRQHAEWLSDALIRTLLPDEVMHRDWTWDRYQTWLTDTLTNALHERPPGT